MVKKRLRRRCWKCGNRLRGGQCLRCGSVAQAAQQQAIRSGRTAEEIAGFDRRREGEL